MKTVTIPEAIEALASINAANGKVILAKPGKDGNPPTAPYVELTLETDINGPLVLTLDQFDRIYRGMVLCWPTVKPLKNQLAQTMRDDAAAARIAKKNEEDVIKLAEKKKREDDREAKAKEVADRKAERETEKAEREAAAIKAKKDAAEKKAKKEAAEKKAKDDAAKKKAKEDKK